MISKKFLLGGRAVLTIKTLERHYTYQILKKSFEQQERTFYFVYHLTGPDNRDDYKYLGRLDLKTGKLILTARSRLPEDSGAVRAVNQTIPRIWAGNSLPPGYEIFHAGKCGRCGLPLTRPESIVRGLGPVCAKVMDSISDHLPDLAHDSPTPKKYEESENNIPEPTTIG